MMLNKANMKGIFSSTGLFLAFIISACGTSYEEPETAIDAGRQFISAIYNGNFKRAGQLVIQDEANAAILENKIEKDFRSRDGFGKEALSKASIQIIEIKNIDSSHTLLLFKNAYTGNETQLEISKIEDTWRVSLLNQQ
jgi:hypothetical protein